MMEERYKFIEPFRQSYQSSGNIEKALAEIRVNGCHQIQAVIAVKAVLNLSLREADETILYSETWKDCLESTIKLRNDFFDALEMSEAEISNLEIKLDLEERENL